MGLTPVDGVHVPNSNGPHDAADSVAKQTNGYGAEDNRGRAERQVVEQVLCGKYLHAGRSIRGRRGGDGAYGMLLQVPAPIVEK